jgi:hypothetical protein
MHKPAHTPFLLTIAEDTDDMIRCGNPLCTHDTWYHLECVKNPDTTGTWWCSECCHDAAENVNLSKNLQLSVMSHIQLIITNRILGEFRLRQQGGVCVNSHMARSLRPLPSRCHPGGRCSRDGIYVESKHVAILAG